MLEIRQLRSPRSSSYLTYINCGLSADYFVGKWRQFGNVLQSNILLLLLITIHKASHNFPLSLYTLPKITTMRTALFCKQSCTRMTGKFSKSFSSLHKTIPLCSLENTGRPEQPHLDISTQDKLSKVKTLMTFRCQDLTPPLPSSRTCRAAGAWLALELEVLSHAAAGTALCQRHSGGPAFPTPEISPYSSRSKPYQRGEILTRKMRLAKSHASLTPRHLVGRGRKSPRQPPDQTQGGGGGAERSKAGRLGPGPGQGERPVRRGLIPCTSFRIGSYSTCRQAD